MPSFQAQVWSPREREPIRKSFRELADAVAWRQEAQAALRRRTLRAPSPQTLREAADDWLAAAEAGVIRTRSGDCYKPSALRGYRQALSGKTVTHRAGALVKESAANPSLTIESCLRRKPTDGDR